MDEYLSEKEQIDQIREWWRENGWYLVGGAVVAGIGYFGYGQYRDYQRVQAAEASTLYGQMQQLIAEDRPGSDALLDQLVAEYPGSPYADQARLLIARELVVSDPSRAASELRAVMETSDDPQLAMVGRLRLARVLTYQGAHADALAVLDVEEPGEFEAQILELRGDIYVAQGAADEARRAYTAAFTAQGAEGLDRNLLQIKLGDLAGVTQPAAPGVAPAAPPAGEPVIEAPAAEVSAPDVGAAAPPQAESAPADAAAAPSDAEATTADDAAAAPAPEASAGEEAAE